MGFIGMWADFLKGYVEEYFQDEDLGDSDD
jgi:hypothetical protein